MPKPMRETTRRNLINRARNAGEKVAAARIATLLRKRYSVLKRELRRGNLRKTLAKSRRDTGELYKADDESWNDWIISFTAELQDVLAPIAVDVYGAETKYWLSRELRPAQVNPQKILDDYQRRTGRQIEDIAQDTQRAVIDEVQKWYNTDAGLPELIDALGQWFNESRAELIARTEAAYISSEVSRGLYDQFGIQYWIWDLSDEPCPVCIALAKNNPYKMGDPMPPEASHPNCLCGTVPSTADGDILVYG